MAEGGDAPAVAAGGRGGARGVDGLAPGRSAGGGRGLVDWIRRGVAGGAAGGVAVVPGVLVLRPELPETASGKREPHFRGVAVWLAGPAEPFVAGAASGPALGVRRGGDAVHGAAVAFQPDRAGG